MATRNPPARTAGSRAPAKAYSSSVRGSAGLARMEEEARKAEQRKEATKLAGGQPFRFFVPVGETREVIVIDDQPDFFRMEHALKNPRSGRFDLFTPCIDEHTNCPVCAKSDKPAYFALYLTVIDLTPYTNRDEVEIPWSKKLMVIKQSQQKKIARIYEREKSLRGAILRCTRDGDKDAAIGNDIEFVEFASEEELETYVDEYTDKDQEVHEVLGYEPFDYDEIFPDLTEKQLESIVGGGTGRSRENLDEPTSSRRAPSGRAVAGRRQVEQEAPEDEAPPPRRAARTAAPAPEPARRAAPRRVAKEEPQDPPQRTAPRRAGSPLPDQPAPATDRAARRANLRSSR